MGWQARLQLDYLFFQCFNFGCDFFSVGHHRRHSFGIVSLGCGLSELDGLNGLVGAPSAWLFFLLGPQFQS